MGRGYTTGQQVVCDLYLVANGSGFNAQWMHFFLTKINWSMLRCSFIYLNRLPVLVTDKSVV